MKRMPLAWLLRPTATAFHPIACDVSDDLTGLEITLDLATDDVWQVDSWTWAAEDNQWLYAGGCGSPNRRGVSQLVIPLRRGTQRRWQACLRSRSGLVSYLVVGETRPRRAPTILPIHHSVAFDSVSAITSGSGVTTLTTAAWTIGGGTNRAGMIGCVFLDNTITLGSSDIGGTVGALIAGTDTTTAVAQRVLCIGVTNPPSGSQTATVNWTTSATLIMGVIVATGVDQTTSFNNGTFATNDNVTNQALTITSVSGDLTATVGYATNPAGPGIVTDQTIKWGGTLTAAPQGGDIGPGTGTTTHTWSTQFTNYRVSGANFAQAAGAAPGTGFIGPIFRSRMREW